MEVLSFDAGIREYKVNSGVLRFNPTDPNLYKRIKNLQNQIESMEKESLSLEEDNDGTDALYKFDLRVKQLLAETFGHGNDFDSIFSGVNVMGMAVNGELVIKNFLDALCPVIEDGVKTYAKLQAEKAVRQAEKERASR